MNEEVLSDLRQAYYLRLLGEEITETEEIDAAIFKLLILSQSPDYNGKARKYLRALSEHHDIPIRAAVEMFANEHEGSGPQEFSLEPEPGKVITLQTFPISKPSVMGSKQFLESVTSVGTHSPRYSDSSSSLPAINKMRRPDDLPAVHGNAQLSRYADVMLVRVDDTNLMGGLREVDVENLSLQRLRGSNAPLSVALLHIGSRLSDVMEIPEEAVISVFREVAERYQYPDEDDDYRGISGVSKSGKEWSLPTIILPGLAGDVQASILASHQLRDTVSGFKSDLIRLFMALPKETDKVVQRYLDKGEDDKDLMKTAAKSGAGSVEDLVRAALSAQEVEISDALNESPSHVSSVLTAFRKDLPDTSSIESRAERIRETISQAKRVMRSLDAGLVANTQPQNAYKGAQKSINLLGRAPYFFYKRERADTSASDYLNGTTNLVRLSADPFWTPFRRLTIFSFEGARVFGDGSEVIREEAVGGIASGKNRRAAVRDFADGALDSALAAFRPLLSTLSPEDKGMLREKLRDDESFLHRCVRRSLEDHARKNKDKLSRKRLDKAFSSRDVRGNLDERAKELIRMIS